MKYFILTLFIVALLWIISIAWHNRRKPLYDNSGSGSGDSIGGGSPSNCGGHDGGCGGGDGGGGGGD